MSASPLGPDWHPAGNAADFEDEDVEQVWVGQLAVAVYQSDGVVVDCIVECPFHQGRFDVRTGAAMGAPVIVPLQTFPVQVVDGRLFVRVLGEQMESLSETMPRPR